MNSCSRIVRVIVGVGLLALGPVGKAPSAGAADAGKPADVKVATQNGKAQLTVNGQPFFIQGAGGGGSKALLAQCGANSFRTWGVGAETQRELDEAQRLGLRVTVGIWLGHKEHGFHYNDANAVKKQLDDVRRAVQRYKDHPALLMWGLGNEMENNDDSVELWQSIEDLAKLVHQLDPHHPTMTVVAEIGGEKVKKIHEHCPSIDVVGINSYGGDVSLPARYKKAGGTKPFVVTEFGPPGTWEIGRTAFGAAPELTSTEKAKHYRDTYEKAVLGARELCLGSYAFTWGSKIEATSTWYGMLLPDGTRLAAADTMQTLWSGKPPQHPCPAIEKLALTSPDQTVAGGKVTAVVAAKDPSGDPLEILWDLRLEQAGYGVDGTGAPATPSFPEAIVENGKAEVTLKMPESGGTYRLYCYLRNKHSGAAVGSLPLKVKGSPTAFKPPRPKLPLRVVGGEASPYSPSGYMGDHKAIQMDADCTEKPHHGKTCLKVAFTQDKGWGGVVWQNPPNDWGDKPGGFDLTGAEKLTFWARGENGNEQVTFGFGLINIDKKFHDNGKAETKVTLTREWKQYTIDLTHCDMSCVKCGFRWVIAGQGHPLTFYLSEVQYEGEP